jgi:tRNA nucleotidyltransferase/poly(A) polymerase
VYDYEYPLAVPTCLDLTTEEQSLLRLIKEVRDRYSPGTTVRIAGGWVRDKLAYGRETPSRDVDLVLSDISGEEFADMVCQYIEEINNGEHGEDVAIEVQRGSGKGKSKAADRLKNANLMINGFDVDFCRLRYEKYTEDSRIPSDIRAATIVEDAWRRDLTINSLYYNLNTDTVEDWTERGLADLVMQTIATPKRPLPTLLEDPTRILRAIRFAGQMSFDVSPALLAAARDERVRDALRKKVSRDAIGGAIDDMFGVRARDPSRGMRLLMDTNLIDVVFPLNGVDDPMALYNTGLERLSRTQSIVTRIFLRMPEMEWDVSRRRLLWYAALLGPVHDKFKLGSTARGDEGKRSRKKGSVFYELMGALRRPKVDVQSIESILSGVETIRTKFLENFDSEADQALIQSTRGLAVADLRWATYRALEPAGASWKEAFIISLASSQLSLDECVERFADVVTLVEDKLLLGQILADKDQPKPLLDGSQIKMALGDGVNGKDFRHICRAMEEWQVRHVRHNIHGVTDTERMRLEMCLIDHLRTAFPEYADGTNTKVKDDQLRT